MEPITITNTNTVTVKPLPALTVSVQKDANTDPRIYMIAYDQLVSVLLVDGGKAQIFRGRVCHFDGFYPDNVTISMDISTNGHAEIVRFHVAFIQEINPIDWEYPNVDPFLVPTPYAYWHEKEGFGYAAVTTRKRPKGFDA